ncbi:sensor histidine kinase [Nonomuraea sp. NPDC050328]|uniref:sensor histidine kinase n=1 Tax=Nonomuraea sp. NPDC050328 TaxID=3364361 RepID=UPI00379E780C
MTSLDLQEARLERLQATVPYLLLTVSVALTWLTDGRTLAEHLLMLGVAAVAATWIALLGRSRHHAVYVAGLIVLIAALCSQGIWFAGFFAFVGYIASWQLLTGRWRFVGIAATATISVTSFTGGLPAPTLPAILTHVFFIAAITSLVALFSLVGDVTAARSSERKRMVNQLEEAMRENAVLHTQLLLQAREAGVLDERQRMAQEIHDTLAQGLTGIIAQIQAATHAQETGAQWQGHLDTAARLARDSLAEARRSVHAIGPGQLETAPLPEALAEVVAGWSGLQAVPAEMTTTGTARPLHPEVEQTLLRIAQEALANVAKHAEARRVGLTLSYMEDVVTLDVRDDGVGFALDRAADGGGFGLTSMRKRVARLAGSLEIESEPGGGTAISATVPAVAREDA